MIKSPSPRQSTVNRKTVLYCPDCEYQDQTTGSWHIHEKTDCEVFECPCCGATVTVRDRLNRAD